MPSASGSSDDVTELSLAFGDLAVTVRRRRLLSSAEPEEERAPSSRAPGAKKVAYSVTHCRRNVSLIGVHKCNWFDLCRRLPGGSLLSSGARLKGFYTVEEAIEFFRASKDGENPVIIEYDNSGEPRR